MQITKTGIIRAASLGSISMQVVEYFITHSGYVLTEEESATIEIPDEWVLMLKREKICYGKQFGHLHLTKAGWDANKSEIKKAYETAIANGLVKDGKTWKDFELFANDYFQKLNSQKKKLIKKLEQQIQDLKNMKV